MAPAADGDLKDMCKCSFQGFFSYGGLIVMIMGITAMMCLFSCPEYQDWCNGGALLLIALALLCVLQSCAMMSISHGLSKVERLSLDELNPQTISKNTKRWGFVAKSMPGCSRINHIAIGFFCLAGLGVGSGCDAKDAKCQAPMNSPNPVRDFGMLLALWVVVAGMGCQSSSGNTALPHIYDPTPAEGGGGAAVGKAFSMGKLCHP